MIVINGMEMPKNCNYCRLNYDQLCHAAMQSFCDHKAEKNGKLKDCPLIEVRVECFKSLQFGAIRRAAEENNEAEV